VAKKFDLDAEMAAEDAARAALDKHRQLRTTNELRAMVRVLAKDLELSDARLESLLALDAVASRVEMRVVPSTKHGREATSVSIGSDWHFEEAIEKKQVSGLNEYSVAIAKDSIEKFFANTVRLVDLNRHARRIDTHVLVLGGDFFSGHIHEDLVEATAMSPTESVLWLEEHIAAGIRLLLRDGGFKRIVVPCVIGNHGRTTQKMRISTATKHSYEWLMYHHLARTFAGEKRLQFAVADGYHVWLDVGGVQVRVHHGDSIRYSGGVGGITIPVNKAIAQWNTARRADLDLFGHYHQLLWGTSFVANGSLIGYGPFSVAVRGAFEPPQQAFFLIDHEHKARTVCAPIRVR
jgi:hypothetical protein